MNAAEPIRAPHGAVCWASNAGWVFDEDEASRHVTAGRSVLVVSDDGHVRGVAEDDPAPIAALLRVEGDLADVVERLGDLAEVVAGVGDLADKVAEMDAGEAVDVAGLRSRLAALIHRVSLLEGRQGGGR